MKALTNSDISQWIDNDEGLYDGGSVQVLIKRRLSREHKEELSSCINKVLNGDEQAHYLKYGR